MAMVCGLDLHRRQFTFDALDVESGEEWRGRIWKPDRARFRRWLREELAPRVGDDSVALAVEGCTGWRYVVEEIEAAGFEAHPAEPADTRAARGRKHRAKTDRFDARLLRDLLAAEELPESWIPPTGVLEWRERMRLYVALINQRRVGCQRIHAELYQHGVAIPEGAIRTAKTRATLADPGLEVSPAARHRITAGYRMIDATDAEAQPLKKDLQRFGTKQPRLQGPGRGPVRHRWADRGGGVVRARRLSPVLPVRASGASHRPGRDGGLLGPSPRRRVPRPARTPDVAVGALRSREELVTPAQSRPPLLRGAEEAARRHKVEAELVSRRNAHTFEVLPRRWVVERTWAGASITGGSECGQVPAPPKRGPTPATVEERLAVVPAVDIRRAMARYVQARSAVLSRSSVDRLVNDLIPLGEFLGAQFPDVSSLRQLERRHIEAFLVWNRTRTWRGRLARNQRVSASVVHSTVLTVRNFLDDIALWGWADRPRRRLVFANDVPRLPRPLPRALAPDIDAALMAAVGRLDDLFARSAIMLLRRAGLRLGECLDLELSCFVDYGPTGTWLRVPLGKLGTERAVPLDAQTVAALDAWAAQRGPQRPHPHPRTGTTTDFLFADQGRRLKPWRIRNGLRQAATAAGLTGSDGQALNPTPHQLRHTFATELANAGMSLQALMAVLGHVTPEMTLRYATLASPTLRAAYDEAIGKVRKTIPVAVAGRPQVPAKVDWIASEFLKTSVAHGYCSRHLPGGACPYSNICETCDNFHPAPEFAPVLQDQLADIHQLRADAEQRGWDSEVERHQRVIDSLEGHLRRLENTSRSQVTT